MTFTTGVTLTNLGIIMLTGIVFYLSHSPWSFAILIAMFGAKTFFEVQCPQCGQEFTPFLKDDE
jgi:type IV secretory pathway VirB3-like protein